MFVLRLEEKEVALQALWKIVTDLTEINEWVTDIVTDDKGNTYYGNDAEDCISSNPKVAALADAINWLQNDKAIKLD